MPTGYFHPPLEQGTINLLWWPAPNLPICWNSFLCVHFAAWKILACERRRCKLANLKARQPRSGAPQLFTWNTFTPFDYFDFNQICIIERIGCGHSFGRRLAKTRLLSSWGQGQPMLIAVNLYFHPPCYCGAKEDLGDHLFTVIAFYFCSCEVDFHFCIILYNKWQKKRIITVSLQA